MHLNYDLNPAKKRGINSGSGLRSLRSVNHAVINKIKFAADEATFKRAVGLYESGKVTEVEEAFGDFTAIVLGTKPYRVSVSGCNYKHGHCTCYLGQKDTLCSIWLPWRYTQLWMAGH